MPTKREREYYAMGFRDGIATGERPYGRRLPTETQTPLGDVGGLSTAEMVSLGYAKRKPKRKLSAWNKYVKANSKKPRFRYARSNKINLKKMAVAFRKTPAGKKRRR